jgi:hypothetical protein
VHLVWGNQDKNWSNTLIPKQAADMRNLRRFNLFNLPEVNERRLFQTKDTVQFEFLKGTPQDMRKRGRAAGLVNRL